MEVIAFGTKAYASGAEFLDASSGTQRSISEKQYRDRQLRAGDLILEVSGGSDRQPVGRTLFVAADMPGVIPSSFMRLLRFDSKQAIPEFMRLVLIDMYNRGVTARLQSNTTSIRNLNVPGLLDEQFELPPTREQERIVDLIGSLDDAIAAAEAMSQSCELAGRSTRKTIFLRVSESAPTAPAGEMFEMMLGRQKSARQATGDYVIPYLRAANISSAGLLLEDVQQMNFDPREQEKYCLRPGDVMLVEGGSLGQSAMWEDHIAGPVGFDKHVIRLRKVAGRSSSQYALQWTRWAYESGAFAAQATGVTIKALGFGRASAMPVPNISMQAQSELCAPLEAADQALTRARREVDRLRQLRSVALTALLSGEHEIPESYDELMETTA